MHFSAVIKVLVFLSSDQAELEGKNAEYWTKVSNVSYFYWHRCFSGFGSYRMLCMKDVMVPAGDTLTQQHTNVSIQKLSE